MLSVTTVFNIPPKGGQEPLKIPFNFGLYDYVEKFEKPLMRNVNNRWHL